MRFSSSAKNQTKMIERKSVGAKRENYALSFRYKLEDEIQVFKSKFTKYIILKA